MPTSFYITLACIDTLWAIFALVWLIGAFRAKRSIYRQPTYQRLILLAIFIVAIVVLRHLPGIHTWLITPTPWSEALGVAICAAGIAWAFWARFYLGDNWSAWVTIKQDHELVQTGPYRLTRHPIYTGVLLAVIGTVLALTPTLGGLCGVCLGIIGLTIKLRQEEALMTRQFPEAYPAYKKRVRAALVPFII